ncbi:MAG TPA: phosphatidic acid phosphatase [Thermoanaerobaculia bacterium]|jgi:hypothetical protein|nr:phosphatidic acid phosphatase [Thermoanaerobaculia bacterium]
MASSDAGRRSEPFLAWPGAANLKVTIPLCLSFLKLFSSVYGGTSLLSAVRSHHPNPAFHFETAVPFVPAMAAVYLTVPLILLLTPFILRTWRDLTPFYLTLTVETLIAGLCFLIVPFAQAYPPRVATGFWGGIFRLADTLNLEYNEVPSLLVACAVTAALVFSRRCGWLGRSLFALWTLAVLLSTLLIHEHHLLDVGAGAALGVAGFLLVQRPASRPAALDALRIEALCLREVSFFARRHPRYLATAVALWVHGLPRWRATRLLRAAWCLAQQVDDVLDGDRKVPAIGDQTQPDAYVDLLIREMTGEEPRGQAPEEILAAFVWDRMDAEQRTALLALFALLREDRRRMDARVAWSAAALAEHHRQTFSLSLDLALALDGSALRAADMPELVAGLAWCSPVRDLKEDLERGLINLPSELLERSTAGIASSPEELLDAPAVQTWLHGEHLRGAAAITALGRKLPTLRDRRGRVFASALHRALVAYEKKYRRRQRDKPERGAELLAGRDVTY